MSRKSGIQKNYIEQNKEVKPSHFYFLGEHYERTRISKELHDGLGQQLATIKLFGQALQNTDNNAKIIQKLNAAIEESIKECRIICHNLYSPILESNGLNKALQLLCKNINSAQLIKIIFKNDLKKINEALELVIYRSVQELICNSIRHGNPKKIIIKLKSINGNIIITVIDDGIGINLKKPFEGIGISNIISRLELLRGTLRFSALKRGTKAVITIPNDYQVSEIIPKMKIMLVDDHALYRDGIKALFYSHSEIEVVEEATNGHEALQMMKNSEADVIIMDIHMPFLNGIDTTKKIKEKYPNKKVLGVSMEVNEECILEIISAGASGYVSKDLCKEELVNAIKKVHVGDHYFGNHSQHKFNYAYYKKQKKKREYIDIYLSKREYEIINYITEGHTNLEIAEKLGISTRTIDAHRRNLLTKFQAKNTAQLIKMAIQKGLVF